MASLQERAGRWQCQFLYLGKRQTFALGGVTEAEAKADQVDYLLMRLDQGLITLPPGADVVAFVRHDGAIPASQVEKPRDVPTLASLWDRYRDTHRASLERHSIRGIDRHFKHLARELGEGFPICDLALSDLQTYVDSGPRRKGREDSSCR